MNFGKAGVVKRGFNRNTIYVYLTYLIVLSVLRRIQ